ncbi:hypothetical protein [Nonomuraea jabiensis]|uniref:Uncharacterized protein n=1 Tax=Nonomuraea jabiensis TaxID=882448 RepID=A0A7W9G474_9ACTN|nr:hypothetical protein [Nonomuraea jabiensis]MBB5776751.1 hypothetical protein [Nonomuraea jabiensis]
MERGEPDAPVQAHQQVVSRGLVLPVAEHAVAPGPLVLTVETGEPRVPGDACAEPDTLSFGWFDYEGFSPSPTG